MADNVGSEVKIKFTTEGASDADKVLQKIQESLKTIQGGLKAFAEKLRETGGQSGLVSVALDTVNQGLVAMATPLGAAAVGFAALAKGLHEAANFAEESSRRNKELYEEMKRLTAVTGDTVANSERFSNAMKLLGADGYAVNIMLARMNMEISNGGQHISKYGIAIRNANGEVKTALEVTEEFLHKLQTMDGAQKLSAASQIFSARTARQLGAAIMSTASEYDAAVAAAGRHEAMNKDVMASAAKLNQALEENRQAWDKLSTTVAMKIDGMQTSWTNFKTRMIDASNAIVNFPGRALNWVADLAESRIGKVLRLIPLVGEALMAAGFLRGPKAAPGAGAEGGPEEPTRTKDVQEGERRTSEMRIKMDYERNVGRLKMDTAYASAKAAIEEDSRSKGFTIQIAANEKEKDLENTRYRDFLAAANLTNDEKERHQFEHEQKLAALDNDSRMKELERSRAFAQEKIRDTEEALKREEIFHRESAARIQQVYDTERGAVAMFAENSAVATAATYKLSVEYAQRETDENLRFIDQRISGKRRELEASKGIAAEERRLTTEIMALQGERAQAEISGLKKREAARREFLEKARSMAAEEAAIGGSLEQKAIGRLQAKGITEFTKADVEQEKSDMGQEARETRGTYGAGGAVSGEALSFSRDYGNTLGQMQKLGTTPWAAGNMFEQQQSAAYGGRAFTANPTALGSMSPELQAIAAQMKASSDDAVERLGATLKDVFEYFVQKLNRKLEFESARH
jgi:hypothetical protein